MMSLAEGSRRAQRRHLTMLFSDLNDSTELASVAEAEDYANLLDELRHCYEYVIPRHGGTIVQVSGDGILAMFGLQAREDEARRATEAALELHESVKKIVYMAMPDHKLTMHSGIHSGLALVIGGDTVFGRYILAGDPPHMAARLSDAAERDEILVSELSLGTDRLFFTTENERRIALKGKKQRVNIFSVVGHSNVNTRFEARIRRGNTELVGREKELEVIRTAFDMCCEEMPQSVVVVASPGMGKTRLIEEFIERLASTNCLILRGYCESYLSAEPLQPVLHILRGLVKPEANDSIQILSDSTSRLLTSFPTLEQHVETLRSFLMPGNTRSKPDEKALIMAMTQCIAQLASAKPVVIFIDDWQWADDATRRVLRPLSTLSELRLLFIVSSRGEIPSNPFGKLTTIRLKPLKNEHTEKIVHALIPNGDNFLAKRLERASGGNPLFLEELCHAARQTDEPVTTGSGPSTSTGTEFGSSSQISSNLKMLIASRISRLSEDQQRVVRVAAVIGNVIPVWLLQEIAGTVARYPLLETLAEQDLIFPGETPNTLRFKHGIARDLTFELVGLHERREWHIMISKALENRYAEGEREDVLEALAYHYGETTEHAKAAEYAEAAGDKALSTATLDRARLQYQAALKAVDQLDKTYSNYERWTSIVRKYFMACLHDARREQLATHQKSIALSAFHHDIAGVKSAEYRLAYIHYVLGDCRKAIDHCERARDVASGSEHMQLEVHITATLGQTRAIACQYNQAMTDLEEALAVQYPFRKNERVAPAFAYSLGAKSMILGEQGLFEKSLLVLDDADAIVEDPKHQIHASLAAMRSGIYLWQGRWEDALEHANRAFNIADRIGSSYMSAVGVAMAAYANWQLKKESAAEQMIRAISWLENHDQEIWTSMHYGWLAEVMVATGQYDKAKHYAARTLQRVRKGERLGECCAYCALAAFPEAAFRHHPSEYYFERAYKSAADRESRREKAMIMLKEARYLNRNSRDKEALGRIKQCRGEFTDMGMSHHVIQSNSLEDRLSLAEIIAS